MIKKILLGLGLVIIGVFTYAYFQPSEYFISRELLINATPEVIFPHINNSQKSQAWMPWSELDPDAQMVYSGPAEGLNSATSWSSSGKMGTGEAIVVESIPNKSVKTKITYTEPMQMFQVGEISLAPTKTGTIVRWSVSGISTILERMVWVFFSMPKMVGDQFEYGLANLQAIVEKK